MEETRKAVIRLIEAILRKNTEQDGNWGWPSFHQELRDILSSLHDEPASRNGQDGLELMSDDQP